MGTEFFTLSRLPDLTLAQYSAEESGGVEDVVRQHASFYRQINRKGQLFDEVYHLIYMYSPHKQPGQRLQMYFRADGSPSGVGPACMEQFMQSGPKYNIHVVFWTGDVKKAQALQLNRALFRERICLEMSGEESKLVNGDELKPMPTGFKAVLIGRNATKFRVYDLPDGRWMSSLFDRLKQQN